MKRILTIHDLSGWGHTSLMASIPILYQQGLQVAAMPSAVLSTNTDYEGYQMQDMSAQMKRSLEHWARLGVSFDAVYSGFLAGEGQVGLVKEAIDRFAAPVGIVLIDPVLGDWGKLYSCYKPSMVEAMRELLPLAEIITPNLSEACLLLGRDYNPRIGHEEAQGYCRELQKMGAKTVIITSAFSPKPGYSAIVGLDERGKDHYLETRYLPSVCPGAGDIFATMLLARLINGDSLGKAISKAAAFVKEGILLALSLGEDPRCGIPLEKALKI